MEYDGPGVSATGDQEWGGYCAWWRSRGRWIALTCWRLTAPATLTTSRILACACRMASSSWARFNRRWSQAQCRDHAAQRPACRACGAACRVKDYRPRRIATLFGMVTVRLPRFRCARCRGDQAGIEWPPQCRSTPEFDQIRAQFSAFLPYRVAAGVLQQLLPLDAGPETLRAHTLKVGEDLRDAAPAEPATAAAAITVSVDSTFIRSCEAGPRHLEVRLGNVETPDGARQVFAAVARTDTAIETLIQRGLAAVGHTDKTDLMAFTDGCSGLRSMLVDAGVKAPPSLDWFHCGCTMPKRQPAPCRSTRRSGRTPRP